MPALQLGQKRRRRVPAVQYVGAVAPLEATRAHLDEMQHGVKIPREMRIAGRLARFVGRLRPGA